MARTYYNENDLYAAQWLRNLIQAGHLPAGWVDERSIAEVQAADIADYRHCHFFAGIGVWALALQRAGWPNDREVWTGSCPCQGHSSAARGRYVEPDWWPEWRRLIAARRPHTIFGEQVAKAKSWLSGVRSDLEGLGYAVGASNLPAIAVGADHLRSRIYFAGHTYRDREPISAVDAEMARLQRARGQPGGVLPEDGASDRMAQMRAFGNAIHAELAQEFVESFIEAMTPA